MTNSESPKRRGDGDLIVFAHSMCTGSVSLGVGISGVCQTTCCVVEENRVSATHVVSIQRKKQRTPTTKNTLSTSS